jgi:glycosyltransferase involved in cell wall biosynthesis
LLARKLPVVGSLIGAYYRGLERRQLARSDGVVIITEAFRDLASAWGGSAKKVHLIENWAAIDDLRVMEKDNSWSREHRLESCFVFLYSGTLGLKHNPVFLIELARLRLQGVKIVVVAQGLGCDRIAEEKQKEALDNLLLLPLQPFERLSEVLASADVLVSVVEAEAGQFSVPSKVQSYLCAERAVLLAAPRANLAAAVVARENAGLVVEPDDIEGFLEAAKALASNRDIARRYGQNGRAFATRQYGIERVADRFEACFQDCPAPAIRWRPKVSTMAEEERGAFGLWRSVRDRHLTNHRASRGAQAKPAPSLSPSD